MSENFKINLTYHVNGAPDEHFFTRENGERYGEYKRYHPNGELHEHYFIVNNQKNGQYRRFNEYGELVERKFFVDGEEADDNFKFIPEEEIHGERISEPEEYEEPEEFSSEGEDPPVSFLEITD